VCELTAETPEYIGGFRIRGEGGRHCIGSAPMNQRLHVLLREDRGWFRPDRTLAEAERVATGFDFDIPLVGDCSRGEVMDVYIETRNLITGGEVQSPRRRVACF
jgi:hypothetical protein